MSKAKTGLSAKQHEDLKALEAMAEEEIDHSDIRATTAEDWEGATVGRFYRPIKQQLTVRIDADVVAWLKSQGKGYQTRINALLRRAMLDDKKH
ncbi:BrnA antitoxin family protein [Rhodocyclaceae bacterium SMB388]